jgi:hypothetical protein
MTNKNVIDIIDRLMDQKTNKIAFNASEAFAVIAHGYYYIRPGKNTFKFLERINKVLEEGWKDRSKMYVETKDGIPFEEWLLGTMAGKAISIARSMFDKEYYRSQIAKMIAFEEYNDHLLERYMYWLNDEELKDVFEGFLVFKHNYDVFISDENFERMMLELRDKCIAVIQESQCYVTHYDEHMEHVNNSLDFCFAYLCKESIVATICKYIDIDPVLLASMIKTFKYSNSRVAAEYTGLAIWLMYGFEVDLFAPKITNVEKIDFDNLDIQYSETMRIKKAESVRIGNLSA